MYDEDEMEAPAAEENTEEAEQIHEDEPEESVEDLKAKVAAAEEARIKAEKAFQDQKRRAELAEKKAPAAEPKPADDLSTTDLYALMQAQVHQDDISEVTTLAKVKGVSIAEALKLPVVKSLLSDNAEIRRTAEATSSGAARRSNARTTDEAMLQAARQGKMPESEDDMVRLINAHLGVSK